MGGSAQLIGGARSGWVPRAFQIKKTSATTQNLFGQHIIKHMSLLLPDNCILQYCTFIVPHSSLLSHLFAVAVIDKATSTTTKAETKCSEESKQPKKRPRNVA